MADMADMSVGCDNKRSQALTQRSTTVAATLLASRSHHRQVANRSRTGYDWGYRRSQTNPAGSEIRRPWWLSKKEIGFIGPFLSSQKLPVLYK
jgi:hypothetical protein